MTTIAAYIVAALAEIAGCFAFWAVLRLEKPLWLLLPGLAVLWLGVLYEPLHHQVVAHAVAMTVGGSLVGLAHLANLHLGHVHSANCGHSL